MAKGQLTSYLILGILLIVLLGIVLYANSTRTTVPEEFQPFYRYLDSCIDMNARCALHQKGFAMGRIKPQKNVPLDLESSYENADLDIFDQLADQCITESPLPAVVTKKKVTTKIDADGKKVTLAMDIALSSTTKNQELWLPRIKKSYSLPAEELYSFSKKITLDSPQTISLLPLMTTNFSLYEWDDNNIILIDGILFKE